MARKLAQVNAVLTTQKAAAEKAVTELYKRVQKESDFVGRSRVYRPMDDEKGSKLPPENQAVRYKASELLKAVAQTWAGVWDLTATQDEGNTSARADVVVDGMKVLENVPVTTLLYLDKQVNDLQTFVSKIPVPDPAEAWAYDPNAGLLRTPPTETVRTSKEPVVIVKYDATDRHPAQTELVQKDVPVGTWTQTLLSGAMPADVKEAALRKLAKLQAAIKDAREEANSRPAPVAKVAEPLLRFAFGDDFAASLGADR